MSVSGQGVKIYEDLSRHIKVIVERFLKLIADKSHTIAEYMEFCTKYEEFEFHKLMETDYFYLQRKKHYLGVVFSNEFAVKLENNKFNYRGANLSSTSTASNSD